MKRFSSSDSLAALMPNSSPKGKKPQKSNLTYSREFQEMLDSLEAEDFIEEASAHGTEKKRRLTMEQVKALEKNFEVDNKLEPERKLKLAEELGLQPRQVAIWFQNRRARWKNKQLERDYGTLKANYEALKLNFSNLAQEKEALTQKLKELKAQVREEKADSSQSFKEECPVSELENNVSVPSQSHDFSENANSSGIIGGEPANLSPSNPLLEWIQLSHSRPILGNGYQVYQPHLRKVEDQSVFSTEEPCNFLSEDHAPSLYWYYPEQ
ncbi:hypothetical protein Tsubulata_016333 [Turnera subulata]|uniref:Homeobox-leucine zipper protein n=1 Tax=Turnera subulata TaxID=218843 RepID=A0A9Q0G7Z8_9ROSI|nr:hypothetical protein Tsubulata_016333 [Turnera subulata]